MDKDCKIEGRYVVGSQYSACRKYRMKYNALEEDPDGGHTSYSDVYDELKVYVE